MINIQRYSRGFEICRCYIPSEALARHSLTPEDLLDKSNIDKFRPLYDEYLDITNDHLDAAVEYIKMLPETQFRLEGCLHATCANRPENSPWC